MQLREGLKVEHNHSNGQPHFLASLANVVLLGFLAIGGYLFLLACPLMRGKV
jgi:hypothetical protein